MSFDVDAAHGRPPTIMEAGTVLPPIAHTITQAGIDAYAEASGDHNPIHVDPTFATAVGLPGTIAHGMLSLGLLASTVDRWVGAWGRVSALSCRFAGLVRPGDQLICRGVVRSVSADGRTMTLTLEGVTGAGVRALTHAEATVEATAPPGERPAGSHGD